MKLSAPLVVRSPNWLGDAILTLPAVANLKRALGSDPLTVAAPAPLAALWEACPFVDRVVRLSQRRSLWTTSQELRRGGFRSALLFPNSLRAALEARLAGIPQIIGFGGRGRGALGVEVVPRRPSAEPGQHQKLDWLHLVASCGAEATEPPGPLLQPPPKESTLHAAPVIICAGAEYGPAKRWPENNYVTVAQQIISRYSVPVIFMGSASDAAQGIELAKRVPGSTNLCGRTSLADFIHQLSRARLFLGNDSGGMHLAAVLGVPGVAIFGSTEPRLTGPLGQTIRVVRHHVPCSPCFLRECPIDFRCMQRVTPAEIMQCCSEILDRSEAVKGRQD